MSSDSPLVPILYFVGALCLIAGIALGMMTWPDTSALDFGDTYEAMAYAPSLTYLFSGLISALCFFAIGKTLDTVLRIYSENLSLKKDITSLAEKLFPSETSPTEDKIA